MTTQSAVGKITIAVVVLLGEQALDEDSTDGVRLGAIVFRSKRGLRARANA